jgi:hypothetical protein
MMRDDDPRATPWGMPGEMQWGEVVAGETPAAPAPADPRGPRDPREAERDFLASLETAHAPAIGAIPPAVPAVPPAAPPVPGGWTPAPPADERDFLASLETARTPAISTRRSKGPRSLRIAGLPSDAPRVAVMAPLAAGNPNSLWGALREVLAQPFPRNLMIGVGAGPFAVLVIGFILQALLAGGDWAHGSLAAGTDALLLALVAAIGVGARYWLGRRTTDFLRLSSALLVALVLVGGLGLGFSHQLHFMQGKAAEGTGAYALAVAQYKLYGEAAPNAPDVARADTTWGEQLSSQHHYADASRVLQEAVIADVKDAALTAHAARDLYTVYAAWLAAGGDGMPYGDAATFLASYRASSACDAACQSAAPALEAQTRLLAGGQLVAAGDYANAVVEFDTIQAQFPNTDYANQAHAAGAKAYLAFGKLLLSDPNTCKGELTTSQTLAQQYQALLGAFQTLTAKYGDTPEGNQGTQMMAAPQNVTGTLTGYPTTTPIPTIHLSKTVNQSQLYFSNEFNSPVDAKSGAFSFANVTPGDYNLHTERDLGYKVDIHIIHSSSGNLYNIHVGALCPLVLGSIPY